MFSSLRTSILNGLLKSCSSDFLAFKTAAIKSITQTTTVKLAFTEAPNAMAVSNTSSKAFSPPTASLLPHPVPNLSSPVLTPRTAFVSPYKATSVDNVRMATSPPDRKHMVPHSIAALTVPATLANNNGHTPRSGYQGPLQGTASTSQPSTEHTDYAALENGNSTGQGAVNPVFMAPAREAGHTAINGDAVPDAVHDLPTPSQWDSQAAVWTSGRRRRYHTSSVVQQQLQLQHPAPPDPHTTAPVMMKTAATASPIRRRRRTSSSISPPATGGQSLNTAISNSGTSMASQTVTQDVQHDGSTGVLSSGPGAGRTNQAVQQQAVLPQHADMHDNRAGQGGTHVQGQAPHSQQGDGVNTTTLQPGTLMGTSSRHMRLTSGYARRGVYFVPDMGLAAAAAGSMNGQQTVAAAGTARAYSSVAADAEVIQHPAPGSDLADVSAMSYTAPGTNHEHHTGMGPSMTLTQDVALNHAAVANGVAPQIVLPYRPPSPPMSASTRRRTSRTSNASPSPTVTSSQQSYSMAHHNSIAPGNVTMQQQPSFAQSGSTMAARSPSPSHAQVGGDVRAIHSAPVEHQAQPGEAIVQHPATAANSVHANNISAALPPTRRRRTGVPSQSPAGDMSLNDTNNENANSQQQPAVVSVTDLYPQEKPPLPVPVAAPYPVARQRRRRPAATAQSQAIQQSVAVQQTTSNAAINTAALAPSDYGLGNLDFTSMIADASNVVSAQIGLAPSSATPGAQDLSSSLTMMSDDFTIMSPEHAREFQDILDSVTPSAMDGLQGVAASTSSADGEEGVASAGRGVSEDGGQQLTEEALALLEKERQMELEKAQIRDVFQVVPGPTAAQDAERLRDALKYLARIPPPKEKIIYGGTKYDDRTNDYRTVKRYIACDTEVALIDVSKQSSVGHGVVNCISMYCGEDVDFSKLRDDGVYAAIKKALDSNDEFEKTVEKVDHEYLQDAFKHLLSSDQMISDWQQTQAFYEFLEKEQDGVMQAAKEQEEREQELIAQGKKVKTKAAKAPVNRTPRPATLQSLVEVRARRYEKAQKQLDLMRQALSAAEIRYASKQQHPVVLRFQDKVKKLEAEVEICEHKIATPGHTAQPRIFVDIWEEVAQNVADEVRTPGTEEYRRYHDWLTEKDPDLAALRYPEHHATAAAASSPASETIDAVDQQATPPSTRAGETVANRTEYAEVSENKIYKVIWRNNKVDVGNRSAPVLHHMKEIMEDPDLKKVWHNYGFDRHVLSNLGMELDGFAGDTMHMARLNDASRSGKKNYSLESLSHDPDVMGIYLLAKGSGKGSKKAAIQNQAKTGMKDIFGYKIKKKDGTEGKLVLLQPMHQLHDVESEWRDRWVHYSALDAKATWQLREALYLHLDQWNREWKVDKYLKHLLFKEHNGGLQEILKDFDAGSAGSAAEAPPPATPTDPAAPLVATSKSRRKGSKSVVKNLSMAAAVGQNKADRTMWDLYRDVWIPFGELLTRLEQRGMPVDRAHLREAQVKAEEDAQRYRDVFKAWVRKVGERYGHTDEYSWEYMNTGSGVQLRQLLFPEHQGAMGLAAAAKNAPTIFMGEQAASKPFGGVVIPVQGEEPPRRSPTPSIFLDSQATLSAEEGIRSHALSDVDSEPGASPAAAAAVVVEKPPPPVPVELSKAQKKKAGLDPGCRAFRILNSKFDPLQRPSNTNRKYIDLTLHGIWGAGVPGKLEPDALTATGAAVVNGKALKGLAGKAGKAKAGKEALLKAMAERKAAAAALAAAYKPLTQYAPEDTSVPSIIDDDEHILADLHGTKGPEVDEEGRVLSGKPLSASGSDGDAQDGEGEDAATDDVNGKKLPALANYASDAAQEARRQRFEEEAKRGGYGKMYAAVAVMYDDDDEARLAGLEACEALEAFCEASAIDKLLTAFIRPLQSDNISTMDENGNYRVHCSLNINTETGRLSARRPNMQNQPALEKDRYKVRKAFKAPEGRTLVVADYGQLELRLLAHMADCRSMLEAFVLGGDFHSRTAYGMYEEIRNDKECVIEYEPGMDKSKVVLLKDKYASQRRMAKILNFSIAYGKTAHGLAKDFGTSLEEARDTVDKWYGDRHEVKKWQDETRENARKLGKDKACVYTLLGRTRPLPDILSEEWGKKGHAERAAINTPIQGAAADVASSAMVAIEQSPWFKEHGFKLLMQVHDEVILEGPAEKAQEAKQYVQMYMANPWAYIDTFIAMRKEKNLGPWDDSIMPLRVELATDCDAAPSWYEAK